MILTLRSNGRRQASLSFLSVEALPALAGVRPWQSRTLGVASGPDRRLGDPCDVGGAHLGVAPVKVVIEVSVGQPVAVSREQACSAGTILDDRSRGGCNATIGRCRSNLAPVCLVSKSK